MLLPSGFAPLPPVILGLVPRILSHQGRSQSSPLVTASLRAEQSITLARAGEGDALALGEGYLKNVQKVLSPRLRHQSFSDLFRESSLNKHLCNNKANLLARLETRCNKILGTRPRMTGAGDADLVSPVSFVLNALLPKVSFFLPNPAKTC